MMIPEIQPFTNRFTGKPVYLLALKRGQNTYVNSTGSNRKTGPIDLAFVVMPESFLRDKSQLKRGETLALHNQKEACDSSCAHTQANYKRQGVEPCYVSFFTLSGYVRLIEQAQEIAQAMGKVREFYFDPENHVVRSTIWGDISILDDEGHDYIKSVLSVSKKRLSYSNSWKRSDQFDGLAQASISTEKELKLSLKKGLKGIYISTPTVSSKMLRELNTEVIRCNANVHNEYTCATCSTLCDGTRVIVSNKTQIIGDDSFVLNSHDYQGEEQEISTVNIFDHLLTMCEEVRP
tara:strand:+ start:879 stop:1754 length:876 start_codon:yes stop_codon:yes gene_type:complete